MPEGGGRSEAPGGWVVWKEEEAQAVVPMRSPKGPPGRRVRPNRALTYAVTYHGHVDFVIKGTVPQPILENPVPAASIRYAFEVRPIPLLSTDPPPRPSLYPFLHLRVVLFAAPDVQSRYGQ